MVRALRFPTQVSLMILIFLVTSTPLASFSDGKTYVRQEHSQEANDDKSVIHRPTNAPNDRIIIPGKSIGNLRIGDSIDSAMSKFPGLKDSIKSEDECGDYYEWIEYDESHISRGVVVVRVENRIITQIESGSRRYSTREGLTFLDSPKKVYKAYPTSLDAFALEGGSGQATGLQPLIFWVDTSKGIAFEFAFTPKTGRYLYREIVFPAGGRLCAEGRKVSKNAQAWRALPPYSLTVPK